MGEGDFTAPFYHISQGTADTASVQVMALYTILYYCACICYTYKTILNCATYTYTLCHCIPNYTLAQCYTIYIYTPYTHTQIIKDGHFAVAFIEGQNSDGSSNGLHTPLPFIVDPSVIFGVDTTLTHPTGFFQKSTDFASFLTTPQGTTSRTPAAYAGAKLTIAPKQSITITTIYGHASNLDEFLHKISPKIRANGYITKKRRSANALVQDITDRVYTKTAIPILDLYFSQDYLDNVLRGGLPVPLGK